MASSTANVWGALADEAKADVLRVVLGLDLGRADSRPSPASKQQVSRLLSARKHGTRRRSESPLVSGLSGTSIDCLYAKCGLVAVVVALGTPGAGLSPTA